jgi:hypothetical protein
MAQGGPQERLSVTSPAATRRLQIIPLFLPGPLGTPGADIPQTAILHSR